MTRCTHAAERDDLSSSSSTNTREIELIADSEPARNPAKRSNEMTERTAEGLML